MSKRNAPNDSLGRRETSQQNGVGRWAYDPKLLPADQHDLRADELAYLGMFDKAYWVRRCSNPADPVGRWSCKLRPCPSCAVRAARSLARVVLSIALTMNCRTPVIFSLRSRGRNDLRDSMRLLRKLFRTACRWNGFNGVRIVGAIEPKLTEAGNAWCPHIHAMVDVDHGALLAVQDQVKSRWNRMTAGRGTFTIGDPHRGDRAYVAGWAHYILKAESWCPAPGSMSPDALGGFLKAVKGLQRIVEANTGRRGRRRTTAAQEVARAA